MKTIQWFSLLTRCHFIFFTPVTVNKYSFLMFSMDGPAETKSQPFLWIIFLNLHHTVLFFLCPVPVHGQTARGHSRHPGERFKRLWLLPPPAKTAPSDGPPAGGQRGRRRPRQRRRRSGDGRRWTRTQGLQVWSLSSFEVSCQLVTNDLSQVLSVSWLMTSSMALAMKGFLSWLGAPHLAEFEFPAKHTCLRKNEREREWVVFVLYYT